MIRRSIHSFTPLAGALAALDMRFGSAWDGGVSIGLEQPNYQPKLRGTDRAEQPD